MDTIPPVVERFLRYVRIDTGSDPTSETVPSTQKQKDLSRLLVDELKDIGLDDAVMDEYGYVFATLPPVPSGTESEKLPVLALLAHVDTAPDESGAGVKPIVHPPYDGSVIALPGDTSVTIDPARQPMLKRHVGERLITGDGTTLLGSDDKAGVAVIMQLAEDLVNDSQPRPRIRLCFTIDEEIGRGVDHLDLDTLGADVAYTLDGSGIDTISFETFNAATATVRIRGRSVHPGYAKGVLVNAIRILGEIIASLPKDEAPESTEDREGYIHPHVVTASDVTESSVTIILRDFTDDGMARRKHFVSDQVDKLRSKYPEAVIELEIADQYRNMRTYIEEADIRTITFAFEAAREEGYSLSDELVRGGTDGARLSEMGLPTPNLFNGGYDYHSRFEWNTVENLERSLAYLRCLISYWARHGTEEA
jgi:tripeptide aminopeptidase